MQTMTTTRTFDRSEVCTECKHGIDISWCSTCKHSGSVYTTAGGTHYHRDVNCHSLRSGQEHVERRGGRPALLKTVMLSSALIDGRDPCRTCCRFEVVG